MARTISYQGLQLSAGQRRQLDFQRQAAKAFLNPVLEQQVAETLLAVDKLEEKGAKPWVDPNKFNIVERKSKGTPSVAEWMGY